MPAPYRPRNTYRARTLRNTATPAERHLWTALRGGRLGTRFSRQMPLGPFFADFLCRDLKLVIELDGFSHESTQAADAARDQWMNQHGYRVLRFTNADVLENVEGVCAAIETAIAEARQTVHP